ncbi:MAG: PKD domain-containing protein [Acidobacteria bacterium]|nr:PKD domain-containing protein [Acidobacteriota bacterium]
MVGHATRCSLVGLGLATLFAVSGCTMQSTEAPPLTGPSELGLSVGIQATPDVLTMDGQSRSEIVVTTRNASGQLQSGIGLRAEIVYQGAIQDFGRLSTKTATTGGDGRAFFSYTAPQGAPAGNSDSGYDIVVIRVIPSHSDYANAVQRTVEIRLVPMGIVLPPADTPVAEFDFSPTAPLEGQSVQFDASRSKDGPDAQEGQNQTITSYQWDFGDGRTGSGKTVSHAFSRPGSFTVTLTVANARGLSSQRTRFVTVGVGQNPTASFTFSPANPEALQSVFFNAAASQAAPGRHLVSYDWTFGNGSFGSGVTVTHRFAVKGTYTVTLTVTDDIGRTGTISQSITLGDDLAPTADFVFSPTNPSISAGSNRVNFDASFSRPPDGRTLTRWEWNFGDGAFGEGQVTSHLYTRAGTFTVVLSVTDNTGQKRSVSKTVTVAP